MGGKRSTSTSQVSIPPEVLARYNAVNTRAEDVASNPFKQYGTTADAFVAPINEQQTAGIANVNASAGLAQPYINAATGVTAAGMGAVNPGELDINKYMSPYIQNVADTTGAMMAQANEQAMSGGLGTAIMSGAFGGDRAGIAAANLNQQQGLAYGKTMADIYQQGYGQAVETAGQQQGVALGAEQANKARLLTGANQIANLGTTAQTAGLQGAEAQINAGTLEQQTEQAGKTALVNQFMQEQGYPFQVAQFLANIAMGTGSLSGSTTTSTQPAPFFSDRRLKEDVKRIGKTDDGLPIYKFKYKGDDTHQTHVGFMADEVEQKKPEAVGLHPSGYKTVDYDKATRSSMGGGVMPGRAGQGFADGGVAGPYGSTPGSQVDFGGYVPQAYLPVGDLMMADPEIMDAARQSMAQQLAAAASIGESVKELDGTWSWAKDKWGSEGREDAAESAAATLGARRAYGGAAYLKTPSGGLVPNSAKTYLSDTLESQSKGDKPELKTAEGNGGSGKSPAENIADLGKMAMMFLGMNGGGRVGYRDGGPPEEETWAEWANRNMKPLREGAVEFGKEAGVRAGAAALGLGAGATGLVSGAAGLGAGALGFPETGNALSNFASDAIELSDVAAGRVFGGEELQNRTISEQLQRENERNAAEEAARNTAADVYRSRMLQTEPPTYPANPNTLGQRLLSNEPPASLETPPPPMTTGDGLSSANISALMPPQRSAMGDRLRRNEPPMSLSGGLVPAAGTPLDAYEMSPDDRPIPVPPQEPALNLPTSPRPVPRPEGLGAAKVTETAVQPAPVVTPGGVQGAPAATRRDGTTYDTSSAKDFFRTKIINQESGGRQFDEDGNPLRSSKGAIGAAQVMEATGPEAAALAGLEWDRDRWLNDQEYNTAIGEAYFLDQYRRFGSLDKAAAAYNAGPGALSSAMDRATALGGSYLDYLPRETQNYVLSTTGIGSGGGLSGAPSGAERNRDGLGAGILTSDKPYEDRNTLGKMFYNEDGTVNRNALLSLVSGVGGMLASPSQFLLPSIGLGLQGAASTYAGLEKQAADIEQTKAQALQARMSADTSRFIQLTNGQVYVNLGNGRTVTLQEYRKNPQAFLTGDPQTDARIREAADEAARIYPEASGGDIAGGAQTLMGTPEVQSYLRRENEIYDVTGQRDMDKATVSSAAAAASGARSALPSLLSQANAVSQLVSDDAAIRSGALANMQIEAARMANSLLSAASRITGTDYGQIAPDGGVAAAQILQKAAIEAGMSSSTGFQELQTILAAQPGAELDADANATLMAGIMVASRRSMEYDRFLRDYQVADGNDNQLLSGADQAFQEVYGRRYLQEKQVLKDLIRHGSEMPQEWANIPGAKTPMEYLMDPNLSAEAKNEIIKKMLTPDEISAISDAEGRINIAQYFGG